MSDELCNNQHSGDDASFDNINLPENDPVRLNDNAYSQSQSTIIPNSVIDLGEIELDYDPTSSNINLKPVVKQKKYSLLSLTQLESHKKGF